MRFDPEHTLYLIDISSFIYRAYYAINRNLKNRKGEPTNAAYGVTTMLLKLINEVNPKYFGIVYDSKEPSFRKKIYNDYKANRSAPPEDLIPQFDKIEAIVKAFDVFSIKQGGTEADDLIASLTHEWQAKSPKNMVIIVSSDKDLMQLVNANVQLWDTLKDKFFGPKEVNEKFGVLPSQIRDYLSLVGDSSDNIPGVSGIGQKTAVALIQEFGSLKAILEASQKNKITGKKAENIKNHQQDAQLSYELVGLRQESSCAISFEELKYEFHLTDACKQLFRELDFSSLLKKLEPKEDVKKGVSLDQHDIFKTIQKESELNALLEKLSQKGEFGFDLETTSLNPRKAEIV
ncbi:MAG: DNA polymerase I, partial [Bdellovibrio sp.]|nr:DNA polymerase I [Bdellovibrio sp.]